MKFKIITSKEHFETLYTKVKYTVCIYFNTEKELLRSWTSPFIYKTCLNTSLYTHTFSRPDGGERVS